MAKKTKYKAKPSGPFSDDDAQVIGVYLQQKFPDGKFTPHDVVHAAQAKSSPIHAYFEWDDTRAAQLYRVRQARKLITCLVVVVDDTPVSQYVSVSAKVSGEDTRQYWDVEEAKDAKDIWDSVLDEALMGLEAWRQRYKSFTQLTELKPVFDAINKVTQWRKGHGNQKESSKKSHKKRQGASASNSGLRGKNNNTPPRIRHSKNNNTRNVPSARK